MTGIVLGGRNVGEAYSLMVNREQRTQAGTGGDWNPKRPILSDQLPFAGPCFLRFQCSKYHCKHLKYGLWGALQIQNSSGWL